MAAGIAPEYGCGAASRVCDCLLSCYVVRALRRVYCDLKSFICGSFVICTFWARSRPSSPSPAYLMEARPGRIARLSCVSLAALSSQALSALRPQLSQKQNRKSQRRNATTETCSTRMTAFVKYSRHAARRTLSTYLSNPTPIYLTHALTPSTTVMTLIFWTNTRASHATQYP